MYRNVNHRVFGLIAVLLGTLAVGCSTTPDVGTDYDPGYNFDNVKKIAVMRPNAALARAGGQESAGVNDLTARRLTTYISDSLRASGYQIVEPDEADLIATFFVSTSDKTDMRTYNTSMSYGRCWSMRYCADWGTPDVRVDQYQEGTLLLDMVNPDTGRLKWRGVTSQRLPEDAPSAQERERIGREVVGRILAQFPPGAQD